MSSDPDELSSMVTECDKEPIHLLGKIQNHGFMVILDSAGVVTYLSKNASHYLNDSATDLMGSLFWERLDRPQSTLPWTDSSYGSIVAD